MLTSTPDSSARLTAVYHVRGDVASIGERARAIAVEQSVEMPVSAIGDPFVLGAILGQVEDVQEPML
jgi:ribulose-bisphosphate carboxylase large chain